MPTAAARLLAAYRATSADRDVRLWAGKDGIQQCLFPGPARESSPESVRLPIATPDGAALELELTAEAASSVEVQLLLQALAEVFAHEHEARLAARELTERYEEINLLYFISEILASVLSLPDAAARILTEVADVLGAKRASMWVYEAADQQLHRVAAVGEGGLTGPIAVDDPKSATAWVFREKEALNLERGTAQESTTRLEPRPRGGEAFLSVPINYTPPDGGHRTVGVITLVGRRSEVRFSAGDARLLAAIASQIGAALETQRLVRESLRQERMVRELELAHDLQLKLLPDPAAYEPPPEVAARCVPAESVGGDFYHLIRLSGNRLGLVIGDVSSHGFAAALIMALTLSAVSISASESHSPAEVLRRVHRALAKELESTEMYLSLFYAVVDPESDRVVWASAGHPYAFLVSPDGSTRRLGATDPPLGMVPVANQHHECSAPWQPGEDLLFVFTDGLSDAFGSGGRSGEAELLAQVVEHRHEPLRRVLDGLFRAAGRSRPTVPPDDRTVLLVRA